MIQKIIEFESFDKLKEGILKNNLKNFQQILIQIFAGNNDSILNELIKILRSELP